MDAPFFKRWEPTEKTIGGRTVRMLFSLRAAARIEAALDASYPEILMEMLQVPKTPEDPVPPPMRLDRQAAVIRILMAEGGQELPPDGLQGMHLGDFLELAKMAQEELALKSWSEIQSKKAGSPGGRSPSAGPS